MSGNVIELYYDCVSPYSWMAFETLVRYEKTLPFELKLKPIFLGGVMLKTGNTPPALACPQKAAYMLKELPILGKYWDVPIKIPKDFMGGAMSQGTLKAQRFLTSIQLNCPQFLEAASRELFKRIWSTDEPVHLVENLRDVAAKIGLLDAENLIGSIDSPRIKELLGERTQEVLKLGAFGAPWIVVKRPNKEDVRLFGSDRMHLIASLLGTPFPGPPVQAKI
ncbi:hypothetical protein L596_026100 [Steinernema carpocapsae]|uniref:Glutathione S-transferase kappa n=1 Tax=Steinernema carpocapsae TaxID=34508 RepID=A0A4V5ZY36_STECR|nr:hypothetical protein L596_026100 [Steinernema carpocapsae]